MLMPSETPIVLKRIGTRPALATESLQIWERSRRCMLHGLPSYHTDEMPTCALDMSSSLMPVAYSMACDAPWDLGCVMAADTLLSFGSSPYRPAVEDRNRLDGL